ncbi:hypothetical protein F5B20DRAFT_526941 [Whalleya microplaca]|nr:hypothetical protein F5B20DRAFT_526941 [Whalleya microplaca]
MRRHVSIFTLYMSWHWLDHSPMVTAISNPISRLLLTGFSCVQYIPLEFKIMSGIVGLPSRPVSKHQLRIRCILSFDTTYTYAPNTIYIAFQRWGYMNT